MKLTINGEVHEVPEGLTVTQLVAHLGIGGPVAVEKNRDIVPRAEHPQAVVCEGDSLEIVHFVGGG